MNYFEANDRGYFIETFDINKISKDVEIMYEEFNK